MNLVKSHMDKSGRILIPYIFRKSLDLKPGEEVILYQERGELKIKTHKDALNRVRQIIKSYNHENLDLVALLLQDRRDESTDV
jgi:bifunctional DNA-binding transcriptional regulator/antitoxin component of YhaV-PrlF toxin-antitoxin module